MIRIFHLLIVMFALLFAGIAMSQPVITQSANQMEIKLNDDVRLIYARRGDLLLGLNQAEVKGVMLSSWKTVQRPVLAQEWGDEREAWPFMKFKDARVDGNRVIITVSLWGNGTQSLYRDLFVYKGDIQAAEASELPEDLKALKADYDAVVQKLEPMIRSDPMVARQYERRERTINRVANAVTESEVRSGPFRLEREQVRIDRVRNRAMNAIMRDPQYQDDAKIIREYRDAMSQYAGKHHGLIHRDLYRFPHFRQPAEVCLISHVNASYEREKDRLVQAGELQIIVEADQRNIAGWVYQGWKQRYVIKLNDDVQVNAIRQLGTWEIDGHAAGKTLVAMRYRGLGDIEEKLEAGTSGAGVTNAFTTTEVIPGAVGGAALISPIVPRSTKKNDRGYALQHRAGAWIVRMARGAGAPFVDFQSTDRAILASFYEQQGNYRALTEIFPGDEVLSQTDETYFTNTSTHKTQPQVYLALVNKDQPLTVWQRRNRWQEVDQYVRDIVSEEMGFVQYEVMPGIGVLSEFGWGPNKAMAWDKYYEDMADHGLDNWAKAGVKMIAHHNPGWVNGRYRGPKEDPESLGHFGGGVCDIYDWVPTKDVKVPWSAYYKKSRELGIRYYPWLGQTQFRYTPFTERVGRDKKHWSLNGPDDAYAPGYGFFRLKGNIYNNKFREEFIGTLRHTREAFGYDGFWVDSFQNLMMSQLSWADSTGNSMQRGWWELMSRWSREGIAIMAESHAFPGMSCSIEIHSWKRDFWAMQHVWRWYRGGEQDKYTPEQLDETLFKMMSVKAWTAPDHSHRMDADFAIPSFAKLSKQYLAAYPSMRRGFILPEGRGILWLPYDSNETGILYVYEKTQRPAGVRVGSVLHDTVELSNDLQAMEVYRIRGDKLLDQFGIRQGTAIDPRFGRAWEWKKLPAIK